MLKQLLTESNDFYPIYLKEHSDVTNRVLHFIGATLFFTFCFIGFIKMHWIYFPIAIFLGYILPGIGHRFFQHNDSFRATKPVLCVICAFKLYWHTLTFQIAKQRKKLTTT